MGKIVAIDTTQMDWQVPGDDWPGRVSAGEPAVRYKSIGGQDSLVKVQIAQYEPGHFEKAHSHATAEILFVLQGELTIGDDLRAIPHTAIFVDKETIYGPLVAGPEGATFLRTEIPG